MIGPKTYIGTAGWSIPKCLHAELRRGGTHLQDYSRKFNAVEINSSFYRDHKPDTYARWAEETPDDFRFSVKLSRYFTHETRLTNTARLHEVLGGVSLLNEKFGVLLIQLPPSLTFDEPVAERFFSALREVCPAPIAFEPRHASWSEPASLDLLAKFEISPVTADPERFPLSPEQRRRVEKLSYLRLHGSPEIYKSKYPSEVLDEIEEGIRENKGRSAWVIFDNTAYGHATENALELTGRRAVVPMGAEL